MDIKRLGISSMTVLMVLLGAVLPAWAHGMIGQRFFPSTLKIDDPFVADEMSLPTVSFMPFPSSGGAPSFRQTDISAELSKRLSTNLGFSLAGDLLVLDPSPGPTQSGFHNIEVALKYVY